MEIDFHQGPVGELAKRTPEALAGLEDVSRYATCYNICPSLRDSVAVLAGMAALPTGSGRNKG